MRSVRVPAFAKINLRLEVVARQPDGYHELRSAFQAISLHDTLKLTLRRGPEIELNIAGAPSLAHRPPGENLAYRAVDALRRELRIRSGVRIELSKRIPVARGLGGGSSDAAAALVGFLRLSEKETPHERLAEIAASLGADVPFFLFGGRALGINRGDEIYPLPDLPPRAVLVVSPREIAVSTREAYRWIDRRLTKRATGPKLWRFCALCWGPQGIGVANDFEAAVFPRHPRLRKIKRELLRRGAAEAALAGSGSAVFGVFPSPAQARRAAQRFPNDQVFICGTVSRAEYRRALVGRGA